RCRMHVPPSVVVDLVDPIMPEASRSMVTQASGTELVAQIVEGPAQRIDLGAQFRQLGTQRGQLSGWCRPSSLGARRGRTRPRARRGGRPRGGVGREPVPGDRPPQELSVTVLLLSRAPGQA